LSDDLNKQRDELRRAYENGTLSEGTYQMLVATLQQPASGQIEVQGSGASAIAGGIAAGERGVAAKEIHGNVYMGTPTNDPVEALNIYRRVFAKGYRHLPMRGIDVGASDPASGSKRIDLDQVYIAVDTTKSVDPEALRQALEGREVSNLVELLEAPAGRAASQGGLSPENGERPKGRPLPALAAVAVSRRAVLLGDPGSGKSTFLNHLGLCLALNHLEPKAGWLTRLPDWPTSEADLVPVHVALRDLARTRPLDQQQVAPQHLWAFIKERLSSQNLEFALDPLHDTLEQGTAILLLDGLDEIPTKKQRAFVREVVATFAERYSSCRLVITCRTLAYQDPAVQFEGLPSFELAPLDEHKIDGFIEAWYAQLGHLNVVNPDTADMLAERLRESVRRPDLWRLAPNPLLLTVMALVHTHKGRLPDARALLYEETVEILLWRWEQIKSERDRAIPVLRQLLLEVHRTDVDLKRILWKLAFDAHQRGAADAADALADIGALQLQRALADLHPAKSLDHAAQIIETIKLRAGLLIERLPDVFTFPHRTFQEYLAGSYLAAQTDFAEQCATLMEEPTLWREVILLAVSRLVYLSGDTDKPLALVAELCPSKLVDTNLAWQKAGLAGQVLEEIGLNRVQDRKMGSDLLERVRLRLADLLRAGALSARERASAGDTLDRLGDPRFRPDAWFLPNEPLLGFVEIPAGPFRMGTDISKIPQLAWLKEANAHFLQRSGVDYLADEHPQHQVHLPASVDHGFILQWVGRWQR
jgi:hypothetical protein